MMDVLGGPEEGLTPLLEEPTGAASVCAQEVTDKLGCAAAAGDAALVRDLLAKGADPNSRDRWWDTPVLVFAASGGRAECVTALLDAGADVNAYDRCGLNALEAAYANGHEECVNLIREAQAKVPQPPPEQVIGELLASDRAFTVREIMERTRLSEDVVIETLLQQQCEKRVRLVAAWQKI